MRNYLNTPDSALLGHRQPPRDLPQADSKQIELANMGAWMARIWFRGASCFKCSEDALSNCSHHYLACASLRGAGVCEGVSDT